MQLMLPDRTTQNSLTQHDDESFESSHLIWRLGSTLLTKARFIATIANGGARLIKGWEGWGFGDRIQYSSNTVAIKLHKICNFSVMKHAKQRSSFAALFGY